MCVSVLLLSLDLNICSLPQNLLRIVGSILHLGNAQFGEGEGGETYITTEPQINTLAKVRTVLLVLLGVQICTKSCEETQPRTDVLLFSSCWLLTALPLRRHSHTRSSKPKEKRSYINRKMDMSVCFRVFFSSFGVKMEMLVSQVISPLSFEQALSARDALAKTVYRRTFNWLVEKINQSLAPKVQF